MLITYYDVIQIAFKHNVKLKAMFSFSSPGVTWETLLVNSLRGGFAGCKIIRKNWINKGESIK